MMKKKKNVISTFFFVYLSMYYRLKIQYGSNIVQHLCPDLLQYE